MSTYRSFHPRQYRPLPLGRIDVWIYSTPMGRRAQVFVTRAITPPTWGPGYLRWMMAANALSAAKAMTLELAKLRTRMDVEEDTQPLDRAALFPEGLGVLA